MMNPHLNTASGNDIVMNILISTGDHSGDFTGSLLFQKLKQLSPQLSCYAIGGERLQAEGAQILADSSGWSAIGLFDALKKIPQAIAGVRSLRKKLKTISLDGVVFIDCPGVNVRLAKLFSSQKEKVRSVYFFPPSAWRRDSRRAAQVGKLVDLVIAPFRETAELYAGAGVPAFFSGHPVLDLVSLHPEKSKLLQEFHLDPRNPVVGIFPGSRDQEITYLLPLMFQALEEILKERRHIQFLLPIARESLKPLILKEIKNRRLPVHAEVGINHKVLQISDFLVMASGTATLEAALAEKPMVIVYKVSPWTWRIERPFLKGVRYAGLPNLLAGKEIVPELIQEKATVGALVGEILDLLYNEPKKEQMVEDLKGVREQLGTPGVMDRVAKRILELFHG